MSLFSINQISVLLRATIFRHENSQKLIILHMQSKKLANIMFSTLLSQASCQALDKPSKSQVEPQQRGLVQSLVAGRQIAAAAVNPGDSCEFASLHYFALCGLGGKKVKCCPVKCTKQYILQAFCHVASPTQLLYHLILLNVVFKLILLNTKVYSMVLK